MTLTSSEGEHQLLPSEELEQTMIGDTKSINDGTNAIGIIHSVDNDNGEQRKDDDTSNNMHKNLVSEQVGQDDTSQSNSQVVPADENSIKLPNTIMEEESKASLIEQEGEGGGTDQVDETLHNQPSEDQQQQQSSAKTQHDNMIKQRKRRTHNATIEGDASTAFSHYRPAPPLSSLYQNSPNVRSDVPPNRLLLNDGSSKNKKRRGKKSRRRERRDDKVDDKIDGDKMVEEKPKDDSEEGIGSSASRTNNGFASQTNAEHTLADINNTNQNMPNSQATDPVHSILETDDPIIQNYLPQLKLVDENYYSKIKPYRMGKRNLPMNQIEVILRRRAVKKRADVQKEIAATIGADKRTGATDESNTKVHQESRRLPPSHNSPPRRKLFPTTQQHSPTPSYRKNGHYEDDSTISSTTVASQLTSSVMPIQQQLSLETSTTTLQQVPIVSTNHAMAISSDIPKEETIGDTSLGLKLTILQGKVIIQDISPLDDGRASPAQLCGGLLSTGDIIIAVNGKSLINGSIHNPVSMERIISVLKPLSQPMDENTKEYSREVRLRFVLGEGLPLLQEQKEREKRKIEEREHRKKLGLDGGKDLTMDPAADLFGMGVFMGVDQHSGMPMFPQHYHDDNNDEEEKKETGNSNVVIATKVSIEDRDLMKHVRVGKQQQMAHPLPLQAQIAHEVQLDRQWMRNRTTSEFFSMNSNTSSLLRAPSPPPVKNLLIENPIDARKRLLERGSETIIHAKSLVSIVESQDNGIDTFEDEDPIEVASRVCGTASVRTGASRRRWHRGDSVIAEDEPSHAPSASSTDNPNADGSTIHSGESGIEACDHRLLVELAANNESWKMNVMKRLDAFANETQQEKELGIQRGNSNGSSNESNEIPPPPTSFDSFLFGGDVTNILERKKQSLALPPGEMTSMLFDLVDLLEGGLPDQIFMKDELQVPGSKAVSFAKINNERNVDVTKATDFLLNQALATWLKSFRPLPWKQRRALWPSHSSTLDGDSMVESRMDDNESLSLMSGATTQTKSTIEKDKRNLRELIEDLELDHETRQETCRLVTFYFLHKFAGESPSPDCRQHSTVSTRLLPQTEEDAADLIDKYGSYLDIYKCLVLAGKLHSKVLVDKLVRVSKYDSQHKEAVKTLRTKSLLFYEPNMLSALLELLPSIPTEQESSKREAFITLLVSAYPDLQPWCVEKASSDSSDHSDDNFYLKYLSALLHHEEGNDVAKQDGNLIREWCLVLCSLKNIKTDVAVSYRQSFFHIASRDSQSSRLYHRDLPFLMDCSVKLSEFGLALSLSNEIVSSPRYRRDKQILLDVMDHIATISGIAIKGNEGEINAVLLGQVVSFYNVISPCMEENDCGFNIVEELLSLLDLCYAEHKNDQEDSLNNIDACISTISENAPPRYSLQVLSEWEHSSDFSSSLLSAIHTSLIRGAREGVRSELSGSLLRIQRAREEGRRPTADNGMMMSWDGNSTELRSEEGDEEGDSIWESILNGTIDIVK